jgi:hypothetical protein
VRLRRRWDPAQREVTRRRLYMMTRGDRSVKCAGRWGWRLAIAFLALACVLCAAISFGVTPADAARLRDYDAAVIRWQSNPDFRRVTIEYVTLGGRAMQVRLCGVPAKTVIMKFRSLPGLPAALAVSSTSESHYRDFSRGELSAYLHLCDEQGVEYGVPMIEQFLARDPPPTDEQIVAFLRSFKMPVPVATDDGAVRSVRALLHDVDRPPVSFLVRTRIGAALAAEVNQASPAPIETMTPAEQEQIWTSLDTWLSRQNVPLWRTKQVSDLLAGIWAQGYGQIYAQGIGWLWCIQRVARWTLCLLAAASVLLIRRMRRGTMTA